MNNMFNADWSLDCFPMMSNGGEGRFRHVGRFLESMIENGTFIAATFRRTRGDFEWDIDIDVICGQNENGKAKDKTRCKRLHAGRDDKGYTT